MLVSSKRKCKQLEFKIMSYISEFDFKKFLRDTVMIVDSPTEK